ncbi:MAG: MBL fold metallo-hydrolase [Candidatus Fermentithermobacillus carboniphilus]|uniref:MBL fold metallo-hydrolase n=1 Tax=Candidatus Fermentithermobacillus carboniphilus TaxID=3085328 RepID=A0AAT9LD01_9FIRM|nr:MAG: MBL fold metallo-hydrolase [Candidatus Fermentithermobacillus carboniphilus]
MQVERLVVGSLATNCYLVFDEKSKKGIIIDPGGDGPYILECIERFGIDPVAIILTHGHLDHTVEAGFIQKAKKVPVYVGAGDLELVRNPGWMKSFMDVEEVPEVKDLRPVKEGDTVTFGDVSLKVLETPGHSPGSISLYGEGHFFSGDLVFRRSIGRTDLPGGDETVLFNSIRNKVLTLPGDTLIHPGHDEPTTVEEERKKNPFLRHFVIS